MSRTRVLDLAKELGIETKVAIAKLQELGVQVKNHFNAISDSDAAKLKAVVRKGKSTESESATKSSQKLIIRRRVETHEMPTGEPSSFSQTQDFEASHSEEVILSEPSIAVASTQVDLPVEKIASVVEKIQKPAELSIEKEVSQQPLKETLQGVPASVVKAQERPQAVPVSKPPVQPLQARPPMSPPAKPSVPSSSGAVIVRRAVDNPSQVPQTPQQGMRRPGSPQQTGSPSGQYRGGRDGGGFSQRPQQDQGGYRRQDNANSPGQRPQPYTSQGQNSSAPRTNYSVQTSGQRNGSYSGPQGAPGSRPFVGGSKPFVMPDAAATPAAGKDMPSRLKDRDKDRDKKRGFEEDFKSPKNARLKGGRFEEEESDFDVIVAEGDGEPIVRTMIPNRKKGSGLKRKEVRKPEPVNPTKASKKIIRIDEFITVNDLAGELSQKATAIIKTLMKLGMMASINQQLDFDTANFVVQEFGFEAQNTSVSIGDILARKTNTIVDENQTSRPPIITIMGHVDHGKTSLLDAIRSANVADKEAGGITQHIGAYEIEHKGRRLTFLDTPGHEAFTSMRARGAKVTDIVVLVVAGDDGVMPQTIEAIAHARAAQVPLIVAINKVDKPGVNIERITRELTDQQVIPEEWGGDCIFVQVSAKTRQGLDELIESILLQADVLDLKATNEGFAEGIVIEARLDKARGPVATVIVTKGILKQQDFIVIGKCSGRVRAMTDDKGQKLAMASTSTPVEIIGIDGVPEAGDPFNCVASDAIAREAVAFRIEKQRQKDLASQRSSSMEDLMALMANAGDDKPKDLAVIIKADTHGSAEAIKSSLHKLDTAKVKTKIILSAVGGITETDAILAQASKALIVGFNVRPDKMASQFAERTGVDIQCFSIIYKLIEAVQAAMLGSLAPVKQDKVIGHAEVRNTFSVPKVGMVCGTMVIDGKVTRNSHVRLLRDNIVIYTGRVGSLKRFKEDAKEVAQGFECGISVENYNDVKVGDTLELFIVEEIAPTLN